MGDYEKQNLHFAIKADYGLKRKTGKSQLREQLETKIWFCLCPLYFKVKEVKMSKTLEQMVQLRLEGLYEAVLSNGEERMGLLIKPDSNGERCPNCRARSARAELICLGDGSLENNRAIRVIDSFCLHCGLSTA